MPVRESRLFTESFSDYADQRMREAEASFGRLTDEQVMSPNLEGHLNEIAQFKFSVAQLRPHEKTGKRRAERRKAMEFGEEIGVDVDVLDISIPYSGFPKSFTLSPSSSHILYEEAYPHSGNGSFLVVTFDEDASLESKLSSFIQRVEENLDRLRQDMDNLRSEILTTLKTKSHLRIQSIKERQQKNKSYSFPVE